MKFVKGGGSGALGLALRLHGAERPGEPGDQRVQAAGQAGERRGDAAGQLAEQLLAGGQLRQARDGVGGQVGALQEAALDRQRLGVRLGERVERLRGDGGVAVDPQQAGRAVEVGQQRLAPRLVGRQPRQGVLDDGVLRVGLAKAVAELRQLLDRETAEVRREDRVDVAQPAGDLGDRRGLLVSVQWVTSIVLGPGGRAGAMGTRQGPPSFVAGLARAACLKAV